MIKLPITLRALKDRKISLIIYSLASTLFTWMYVAMFPTIRDQAEEFTTLVENYPVELLEAFGIEEVGFDTLEKFLHIENYSFIIPLMIIFITVSTAGAALAGEIERGTIENILAQAVSRTRLFVEKYLAGIIILVIFTLISVFSALPLATLHNVDYSAEKYITVAMVTLLFGWTVFSISMLFSAIFSERSKTYMLTGGIILVMYVANIAALLMDSLEKLKYTSFFYYYDVHAALINNTISTESVLFFTSISVITTILGAWVFHQRDIVV